MREKAVRLSLQPESQLQTQRDDGVGSRVAPRIRQRLNNFLLKRLNSQTMPSSYFVMNVPSMSGTLRRSGDHHVCREEHRC